MQKTKLKVEYVEIKSLNPAEYNPRTWDSNQEEKLTDSIKRFGLVDPLIVNASPKRKNILIGGHFRYQVAKKLKIKKVPVVSRLPHFF
jgi:ParB-like chromosome segregation protein Spo0J